MKNKFILLFSLVLILSGCAGVSSKGVFGTGVSVAFDPRSVGTQIDDSIMQKSLSTKIILLDKSYFLSVKSKVLDGRIFLTGKVDNPEEKLKLTKLAWEIQGVRSVRNDVKIKEEFSFKQSAHISNERNIPSIYFSIGFKCAWFIICPQINRCLKLFFCLGLEA